MPRRQMIVPSASSSSSVTTATATTTDATQTTCGTVTIPSGTRAVEAVVTATSGSDVCTWRLLQPFTSDGSTATAMDSIDLPPSNSSLGWLATLDASGSTARVRVTGALATSISWRSTITLY